LRVKDEEKCKVVEAMSHNQGSRVTIIYYGLGAYTFPLKYNVYDAYLMYHIPNSDVQFVKLDQYVYV
jgi:hypothetical protein